MRSLALWPLALLAFCCTPVHGQEGKTLSPKELFAKASPAVVRVRVYGKDGKPTGQASGFFVSADGLLVTNYHVIGKAASAKVVLADGKNLAVAGVVSCMPNADLALLKVDAKKVPFLSIAREKPEVGTKVYAIGSPEGLTNTLSDGLVSGLRKVNDTISVIQTTAPVSQGSSGGPLLIATGQVVGVTTATLATGQNLNFAVPCRYIRALIVLAGDPRPLPEAQPKGASPKKEIAAHTFSSFEAILSEMPRDFFPKAQMPRRWTPLTFSLFNGWAQRDLVGKQLVLRRISWRGGVLREKLSRSERGAGLKGPSIIAGLYRSDRCRDGRTYYMRLSCYFDPERLKNLTALDLGDLVDITGRIVQVRLRQSRGSDLFGTSIPPYHWSAREFPIPPHRKDLKLSRDRKLKRTGREFYRDESGVGLSITLRDCRVAPHRREAPPKQPRRPRRLAPEEKARAKLRLAEAYLATGKKEKAKAIFRAVVADYPRTKAAAEAKKELERLKAIE